MRLSECTMNYQDALPDDIACLTGASTPAALISTSGYHCEVWRTTINARRNGEVERWDIVVKRFREPCPLPEVRVMARDYRVLKARLQEIVPTALFVATPVAGQNSVIVLAEAVTPWFNIANPVNESETVPLLRHLPRAREQLARFVAAAQDWYSQDKLIDLYGLDNLVLDVNRDIRYVDSFRVFFYTDLEQVIGAADEGWRTRMELSRQRLEYLDYLLRVVAAEPL